MILHLFQLLFRNAESCTLGIVTELLFSGRIFCVDGLMRFPDGADQISTRLCGLCRGTLTER
jgi:hypothetical protein